MFAVFVFEHHVWTILKLYVNLTHKNILQFCI